MAHRDASLPTELPRRGNALTAWLGRSVLGLLGWRVTGRFPEISKLVVILAPHTSAWDFVIGLAAKLALRLEAAYLAKDSLFVWPLSVLLRRTGGIPVDRSGPHNLVDRLAAHFAERDRLLLALAPEGTRRRVDRWKSGFYRIAEAARVPIVPVALDYGRKAVVVGTPFTPTGDARRDTAELREFFRGVEGRRRRVGGRSAV